MIQLIIKALLIHQNRVVFNQLSIIKKTEHEMKLNYSNL